MTKSPPELRLCGEGTCVQQWIGVGNPDVQRTKATEPIIQGANPWWGHLAEQLNCSVSEAVCATAAHEIGGE